MTGSGKMTKLMIQIPCLNEEKYLPGTYTDLPKQIAGIDEIETLVIDDGSSDRTAEVARELGVTHIICFKRHQGLAKGFMAGLEYSLKQNADIIVNFDADNAFKGSDIERIILPILKGTCDIVIGSRDINAVTHYSFAKKILQKAGSFVVRKLSGTDVKDAPCGFRAFSREAALQMNVISEYSYTLETIIQAGQKGLVIESVDIEMNEKLRESRLITHTPAYVYKSVITLIRIFTLYRPLRVFTLMGSVSIFFGTLIGVRYIVLQIMGTEKDVFASLILSAVLLIMGINLFVLGLLADLIGSNTHSIETILTKLKRMETVTENDAAGIDNTQSTP